MKLAADESIEIEAGSFRITVSNSDPVPRVEIKRGKVVLMDWGMMSTQAEGDTNPPAPEAAGG